MRTTPLKAPLRLRLVCMAPPADNPPDGAEVCGLQDTHGQLDPGAVQPDGSTVYETTVFSTLRPGEDSLRFSGPFVHGPAGAAFLYLSVRDPLSGTWVRRLKIPLTSITRHQAEAAGATKQVYLVARIAGTGSGTVPLLDAGWVAGSPE